MMEKGVFCAYSDSKNPGLVKPHTLESDFALQCYIRMYLMTRSNEQQWLRSACGYAQVDLSLRCPHMPPKAHFPMLRLFREKRSKYWPFSVSICSTVLKVSQYCCKTSISKNQWRKYKILSFINRKKIQNALYYRHDRNCIDETNFWP